MNKLLEDISVVIKIDPENAQAFKKRGYIKYMLKDAEGSCIDHHEAIKLGENTAEIIAKYCK